MFNGHRINKFICIITRSLHFYMDLSFATILQYIKHIYVNILFAKGTKMFRYTFLMPQSLRDTFINQTGI